MDSSRLLARVALGASFFALCVIALGVFTRLIDAGLGCPDWPGCYGHLTAPLSYAQQSLLTVDYPGTQLVIHKAWAEMIHRYFVSGLSLLISIIVAIIFIKRSARTKSNILLALALIFLLVYQILLGQWTVTLKLLPIIVSQHLLGGYLILATLWVIYLINKKSQLTYVDTRKVIPWVAIGLVLVLIQILLGAWTSTNYASLSCPDFPFCMNDQSHPFYFKEAFNLVSPIGINYEGGVLSTVIRQTIQMAHRFGALIVTLYFLILIAVTSIRFNYNPILMKSVYLILSLLLLQICLGISNIIFKLPLATAILHTVVAALLLLSVLTFLIKLVLINRKGSLT